MTNFVTEPLVGVVGILSAHLVVLMHVLSQPRMVSNLLSEQRLEDLGIRSRATIKEQRVPISDELDEVIIPHV